MMTFDAPKSIRTVPITTALQGGIIVARGTTPITDPSSTLHQRYDARIQTDGFGYLSVSTGKLTSAPANALLLQNVFGDMLDFGVAPP